MSGIMVLIVFVTLLQLEHTATAENIMVCIVHSMAVSFTFVKTLNCFVLFYFILFFVLFAFSSFPLFQYVWVLVVLVLRLQKSPKTTKMLAAGSAIFGLAGIVFVAYSESATMATEQKDSLENGLSVNGSTLEKVRIVPDDTSNPSLTGSASMVAVVTVIFVIFVASAYKGASNKATLERLKIARFLDTYQQVLSEDPSVSSQEHLAAMNLNVRRLKPGNNNNILDQYRKNGGNPRKSTIAVVIELVLVALVFFCF